MVSLYNKYRPRKLESIVGQPSAIAKLQGYIKRNNVPRAMIFTGPSGCGKSTAAHIMARHVGARQLDLVSINCAIIEPMDTVRTIESDSRSRPMFGKSKVWILDEVQSLSRAKGAQEALLMMLEDLEEKREYVYFMLCTTDEKRIIPTIRNRCAEIRMGNVPSGEMARLLLAVLNKEGKKQGVEVTGRIITLAEGSPRKALVLLESIIDLDEESALEGLTKTEAEAVGFDLVRALGIYGRAESWKKVSEILKKIEEENHEGLRHLILKCCRNQLHKDPARGAIYYNIIQSMREPLFDQNSAIALFEAACFEIVASQSKR